MNILFIAAICCFLRPTSSLGVDRRLFPAGCSVSCGGGTKWIMGSHALSRSLFHPESCNTSPCSGTSPKPCPKVCEIPAFRKLCPARCKAATTREKNKKRDCAWTAFGPYGPCHNVTNDPDSGGVLNIAKRRQRAKVAALHGGADCVGKSFEYTACSIKEYKAATFVGTVLSVMRGSSTAAKTAKKCVNNVYGDDGQIVMSGRKCPAARKRRAVSETADIIQRRTKRDKPLQYRDVLFVLDESGSVGETNLAKAVELATVICHKFDSTISIAKNQTRVGVLTFDEVIHTPIDFDRYYERAKLIKAMKEIEYTRKTAGSTCLVNALNYTKEEMFTKLHGSRPEADKMVIIVTDGCSNCEPEEDMIGKMKEVGQNFVDDGIIVLIFTISPTPRCFEIMEGLIDGRECFQHYRDESWEDFDDTIKMMDDVDWQGEYIMGVSCEE